MCRFAYRLAGNCIVEQYHRTFNGMAARSGRDVMSNVFWYKLAPGAHQNEDSAPYHLLFYHAGDEKSVCHHRP